MTQSTSELAIQASKERKRLQASFQDLKQHLEKTLDVKAHVRKNVLPISGFISLAAAVLGYGMAAAISRR